MQKESKEKQCSGNWRITKKNLLVRQETQQPRLQNHLRSIRGFKADLDTQGNLENLPTVAGCRRTFGFKRYISKVLKFRDKIN